MVPVFICPENTDNIENSIRGCLVAVLESRTKNSENTFGKSMVVSHNSFSRTVTKEGLNTNNKNSFHNVLFFFLPQGVEFVFLLSF